MNENRPFSTSSALAAPRRGRLRVVLLGLLPLLVIGLAIAGFIGLVKTRPTVAPAAGEERRWPVAVTAVQIADIQPVFKVYGELVAGREVELRALVAGEVIEVAAAFRDGAAVAAGTILLQIDDFEYQAALDENQARLAEAKARLAEINANRAAEVDNLARDTEMLALRQRELDRVARLRQRGTASEKSLDDAKMALSQQRQTTTTRGYTLTMQDARISQQQAAIQAIEVALRRAKRDIERTRLSAPFAGYLSEPAVELGQRIGINDRVVRLIDTTDLEARVHISDDQYGRLLGDDGGLIGRPAEIIWRSASTERRYDATVTRIAARIDPATGGAWLYLKVRLPTAQEPVRAGSFVEVVLTDRLYRAVAALPQSAVFDGNTVYAVVDGRLVRRAVTVRGRNGDLVLVDGELRPGEPIVTTRFAEIGPGTAVQIRRPAAAQ